MWSNVILDPASLDLVHWPTIDCHLHTNWTDGAGTVAEVYQAAAEAGLTTILYSEHSRKNSTDWFGKFAAEVKALPTSPLRALVGTEVKFEDLEGTLDTCDEIQTHCDLIMGSVHRFPKADGGAHAFAEVDPAHAVDMEFQLSWEGLANPKLDILGHMFGMSIRRFHQIPPDELFRKLIQRAADYQVCIEVNSHYHPEPMKIVHWCRDFGTPISFGSNAHLVSEVGQIYRVMNGLELPCQSPSES